MDQFKVEKTIQVPVVISEKGVQHILSLYMEENVANCNESVLLNFRMDRCLLGYF